MNIEELKKEAEEFTDSKKSFWRQGRTCIDSVKQAYLAGALPREKRIEELEEHNIDLIGKVAFLENDLNNAKAQNEKMKCCGNCKYRDDMTSYCKKHKKEIYIFMVDSKCNDWKLFD